MYARGWITCGLALAVTAAWSWCQAETPQAKVDSTVTSAGQPHRSPVAVALTDHGRLALSANSTSGSVSLVDVNRGELLQELAVGAGPADVVWIDPDLAAVSLKDADSLVFVRRSGDTLTLERVVAIGDEPRGMAVHRADGQPPRLFVTLSTSDRIAVVNPATGEIDATWETGGVPRTLTISPNGRWLASCCNSPAEILVHDVQSGELISRRKVFDVAFNLGTPVVTPDNSLLLLPHAVNRGFPVTTRNIEIGWVIDNRLTKFPMPDGDIGDQKQMGLDVHAAAVGDAHAAVLSPDGKWVVVSCGGSHELLMLQLDAIPWPGGDPGDFLPRELERNRQAFGRIRLGGRPLGLQFAGESTVVVANALKNSLQVVDLADRKVIREISLGGPSELSLARRGEQLFYDADRSHNSWYSCHTCHTEGHTSQQMFDTKNDGGYGAPKLTPTLRAVTATGPWTWHGWQTDLSDAMRRSLKESMSTQKEITAADTAALLAYLETLEPAANPHRTSTGDLTGAARRGLAVFEGKGGCAECHAGDHLTSDKIYAVGLVGPRDRMREFNPPTLRGLYTRRRFLHDGRAKSLEEVLSKHHRPEDIAGEALTEQELADLLDYLRSL